MLRLSIIVPHLDDDSKLEETLLSLLESRESIHEIIVVHRGHYTDPYDLGRDEVVMIQAPESYSEMEGINLAVSSATSPVIQILLPGTKVLGQWANEALDLIESTHCAAVQVPIAIESTNETVFGLNDRVLPHRRYLNRRSKTLSPTLVGTLYRKKVLRLVGGWFSKLGREGAELELGLLFSAMELEVGSSESVTMQASRRALEGIENGYEIGRLSGMLACSYGAVEGSGVCVDSLAKQISHLAGGLMSPKTVAERLGWVLGMRDHSIDQLIRDRLIEAADNLDDEADALQFELQKTRRAA